MIVPTDTPSVFDTLSALSTLEKQALVRPDNPPPGIAGFVFDLNHTETAEFQSDITDHYVENNTAVQDQIVLKPEKITLRGMVAEVAQVMVTNDEVSNVLEEIPFNQALVPELSQGQTDAIAAQLKESVAKKQSLVGTNSLNQYYNDRSGLKKGKQAMAFNYFYQLWKGRQLFSIDTPWGFFTGMALESLRAEQNEDSKYISDFTVTFKKIRFAQEIVVQIAQPSGRTAEQEKPKTENGVASQKPVDPATRGQLFVKNSFWGSLGL